MLTIGEIESTVDALEELSKTDRNLFQRIMDVIRDFIRILRGEPQTKSLVKDLEYIEQRLARVYNSADTKKAAKNSGEEQYSLNINAKNELHKALYDKNYRNEVLLRDETPAIMLAQNGVKNRPMAMKASHIRENVFTEAEARKQGLRIDEKTHYHGLGEDFFLEIIDNLDNVKEAYRGTKNANMPSRRENYFLLVSKFKDGNGDTINVPVYINEGAICNNVYLDVNKIATNFGRNDFRNYVNRQIQNGNLVKIKNKSDKSSEGGVPLTPAYENTTLKDSIHKNKPTVNSKSMQESKKNSPKPENEEGQLSTGSPMQEARESFAMQQARTNV